MAAFSIVVETVVVVIVAAAVSNAKYSKSRTIRAHKCIVVVAIETIYYSTYLRYI